MTTRTAPTSTAEQDFCRQYNLLTLAEQRRQGTAGPAPATQVQPWPYNQRADIARHWSA